MEAICKSVPADMVVVMANKESAKAAWDDIKMVNLSIERVRRAKAQTLRREFDALIFKDGESVDEFAVRISTLVQELRMLGDNNSEPTVVRKLLQALPPRFHQIALSIVTLLDLETLSVEELVGRLKAAEERHDLSGGGNNIVRLNLTEEELVARVSKKLQLSGGSSNSGNPGSSGSEGGRGGSRGRGRGGGRGSGRGGGAKKTGGDAGRERNGYIAGDECRYCGHKGHWAASAVRRNATKPRTWRKPRRRRILS